MSRFDVTNCLYQVVWSLVTNLCLHLLASPDRINVTKLFVSGDGSRHKLCLVRMHKLTCHFLEFEMAFEMDFTPVGQALVSTATSAVTRTTVICPLHMWPVVEHDDVLVHWANFAIWHARTACTMCAANVMLLESEEVCPENQVIAMPVSRVSETIHTQGRLCNAAR